MKKIKFIALLLIIPMVLSFAACKSGGENAYRLYRDAFEKTNNLSDKTQYEEVNLDMSLTEEGETAKIKIQTKAEGKYKNYMKDDMIMEAHQTQKTTGDLGNVTTELSFFIDSDNVYISSNGSAFSVVSRDSDSGKLFFESLEKQWEIARKGWGKDAFRGAKVTKNTDGSYLIEAFPNDKQATEMARANIDSMRSLYENLGAHDIKCKLSDVKATIKIDPDGYLTEAIMDSKIKMTMTFSGAAASVNADSTSIVRFTDIGKPVDINIPAR